MSFVVAMHVALLFVLARNFGLVSTTRFEGSDTFIIDESIEPDRPPPVRDPEYQQSDVALVPRETTFDNESDTERTITQTPRDEIIDDDGRGSGEVVPTIVNVRADPRHPLTQPLYPPADRGLGNEGSVDIEIYVLPNGRVGDARVVRSSGFERMDQSALDEAKRRWRLAPATRDGVPFAQWHRLRVKFELKK